ncbi:MAG: ARC6/PARC6 family protein [Synechococcus sp. cluster2_bin.209]|nr:ARC6/PARC6 family protein [Synechococcus sp. cluster2_bin.209]
MKLLDLPIDHFRLLGVSPSADAAAILHRLQTRCDSPPDQGFTHEALLKRNELLGRSADLLTDRDDRAEYESALLRLSASHPNETVGLDLPASSEVAGLILLWEGHGALEAFQMASHGLQPPQAPALGSGREADLTLLAALACRDAAVEEQGQRRYESAAQLLVEGIQLQQRMGKLPDQQRLLERDLDALLPFRVLDLISRDLGDQASHQQGLTLLDQLVSHRGGLDGTDFVTSSETAGSMSQEDFESFFQQIRRFLTVQEQIDLFGRWSEEGEAEAGFLAVLALTAAGFSRRKPECLEQARGRLQLLPDSELDPMPLLGCLDLLLGNVREADHHFAAIRDADVQAWFVQHPGDSLAAQCEYCRAWLGRDVLPGYRDVDATAIDLDAWFADRDVQNYVERLDRQASRPPLNDALPLPWETTVASGLGLQALDSMSTSNDSSKESLGGLEARGIRLPALSLPQMPQLPRLPQLPPRPFVVKIAVLAAVLAAFGGGLSLMLRQRSEAPPVSPVVTEEPVLPAPDDLDETSLPIATLQPEQPLDRPIEPLTSDAPSDKQLEDLIQGWLDAKAKALAGQTNAAPEAVSKQISTVARDRLLQRVQAERTADAALGHTKIIKASVTSVDVVSRTPRRIAVKAQVNYFDQTLDRSGTTIDQTPAGALTVTYVLGRDGEQWKLHEYISGS